MHNISKKAKVFVGSLTIFGLLLSGLFFLGDGNVSLAREKDGSDDFVADEVIVKFKGDSKPFRVVKLPPGKSVKEAEEEWERNSQVEYAEPNYIARAFLVPNDPYYSFQWHLQNPTYGGINMETAWDVSNGAGVVVAVVDTGVAYENFEKYQLAPDLAGTVFVPGYDFINDDTHPNDDNNHGTHVAGTIAQSTNNNLGVAGIAFGSSIMPVKVLDEDGMGTYADVANGIIFATDNGAKVINLSLGGSMPSLTLENAIAYAYNNGVTVVAAAGNDGSSLVSYPAAYDAYVIAVGATRYDETLAYYSNYGSSVDLVAPGGDLRVDQNNDGYGDGVLQQTFGRKPWQFGYYFFQGTSMAAPHVAGTVALVIANGVIGPDAVRNALETSAEDLGTPGRDSTYGWGLVDAAAALGPVDTPPSVSVASPLNNATVSGLVTISATASDDVGVVRVDFLADNVLLGSDLTAPYNWLWDSTTVVDGTHTLTATAIDTIGQGASNAVSVLVDNVNDSPVANAGPDQVLSDNDGTGSETTTLDGSASYDPDGTITSYEWKEGATVLGTAATLTSSFAVGTHTITLTVTDNDSATASDTVVITVNANQPPTANAGPDQAAYVNQAVSFDGSGSTDDGTVVAYVWDFGDGSTGAGIITSHVYTVAGTYTVILVVTDNGGLTGSDTAVITVQPQPAVNVSITRFDARDIDLGDTYDIRGQVKNLDPASATITLRLRVYDSIGTTLVDSTLPDKTVTLGPNGAAKVSWDNPNSLSPGDYLAKITVVENPTTQASDLFNVFSGGDSDD